MKKLFLTLISFVNLISISAKAQQITSCQNSGLVRKSEIIIAKGDVMATKNGESKAFSLGQYEVASVVCLNDFFDHNSTEIKEMIAVRLNLSSTVPESLIDPNGFNSGMMTMETEFENMSENKLIDISRMEGEVLTFNRLKNGNLVRKLEIPLSPAYATSFQTISDSWTRDHLVPFFPYLIRGKIQNTKIREVSCAIRSLKAKLNLSKAGESLEAIVELKNFKACP
jgi:hypothetical protein